MAGKAVTRGTARMAYALDALSKNARADVLLERAQAELGEEATDDQLAALMQTWLDPVLRLRGDKSVNLATWAARFDRYQDDYRRRIAAANPPHGA